MFDSWTMAGNDNRRERSILAPVNRVSLFGRLAADPEVRVTGCGRWIVHLSLATDERNGSMGASPAATLNRVVVVDDTLSRLAGTQLTKGQRIHVEGQLQTRPSTDGSDRPLVTTEIVLSGHQARLVVLDERVAFVT